MRTGVGDCKDKIRLFQSLALALGFEAEAVLLHVSGERELVPELPSPNQFDHVVARVRLGERELWFDPTSEMTRPGELPAGGRDLAGVALRVATESGGRKVPDRETRVRGEVVRTPASSALPTELVLETTGTIAADGSGSARVRLTLTGDEESFRLVFKYGDESVRRAIIDRIASGWGAKAQTKSVRFLDPGRVEEPFWVEAEVEWPAGASLWRETTGLLLPAGLLGLEEPETESERAKGKPAPARIGLEQPRRQLVRSRFELPEGVRAYPPVPLSLERGFARYSSTYRVDGRAVELERELVRTVDEVGAGDFADLRNFASLLRRDAGQRFKLDVPPELAAGGDSADELFDLCDEAVDEDRFVDAVASCSKALEREPDHERVWNLLGIALDRLGRRAEAKVAYERQIELDPHHGFAYANLGLLAWAEGDLALGEQLLRRQIEVAPLEAFAHGRLGRLLIDTRRLDEAELALRTALRLGSDDPRTTSSLLEVLTRGDRYPELVELALAQSDALTETIGLPVLLYSLTLDLEGEALELATMIEEKSRGAIERLKRSVELPPTEEEIAATYIVVAGWEVRARVALRDGKLDEAWNLFDAALRFSQSPSAAEGCARVRAKQGRAAEADRLLAISVSLAADKREMFERRLATSVPSAAARRALLDSIGEESWRLRSQSRNVPGSAGQQGEIWARVAPDGAVQRAVAAVPDSVEAVRRSLASRTLRFAAPPGSDVPLVSKLLVHCSMSDECTVLLEPPVKVWRELRAGRN